MLSGLCHGYLFWVCNFGIQLVYSPSTFYRIKLRSISRILEDLEQESQRRTREVEALEQQLSKAAADTWRDLPSWKWTKWPDIDFASSNVAGKRMLVRKLMR